MQGPPMVPGPPGMVSGPPMVPPQNPVAQLPQAVVKKPEEQTSTLYVGKIPSTVEDEFIRKLLEVFVIHLCCLFHNTNNEHLSPHSVFPFP